MLWNRAVLESERQCKLMFCGSFPQGFIVCYFFTAVLLYLHIFLFTHVMSVMYIILNLFTQYLLLIAMSVSLKCFVGSLTSLLSRVGVTKNRTAHTARKLR